MKKKNKNQPTLKKDVSLLKADVSVLKTDVATIKTTMATKEDLKGFATKEDLKGFATKEDLKGFATKEDLKGFATKEDLSREVKKLESSINFVYTEFCDFRYYVEENMLTKRDFLSHIEGIEDILAEMRDFNMQRQRMENQMGRLDDKVDNHEKRITILEKTRT